MTAQEEDFERGNSSKDGRADGPDDDDHGRPMTRDKSPRKKRRRHKETRGTRRERTELAQVASSDGNDKIREVDNKVVKKLSEMKGSPCPKYCRAVQ